jgi:AraC-like DNA-binding protein
MHKHSMFELVYYCSGSGYTTVDGNRCDYSPSDFVIIGPGVVHDEYRYEDTSVIYFGFFHHLDCIRLSTGIYRDDGGNILPLLQEMAEEARNKRNHFTLKLDVLLQCALIEIDRLCEKEAALGSEEKLRQTIQYIQQYYSDQINLTQLAKMSGYSYDHFRHLFKDHMRITPMNYIIHLRIEKAKELLAEKTVNMTQISLECGFSSLSHFSNAFKKETGKSPREFVLEIEHEKRLGKFRGIKKEDRLVTRSVPVSTHDE